MRALILTLLLMCIVYTQGCITHRDLWSCAIKNAASYNKKCITPADIHRQVKKHLPILTQPVLLGIEGSNYRKLFEHCDVNSDGCIHVEEITNTLCERDCSWRRLFSDIVKCT